MHVTILGSAAAEGWPALFCTCEACAEALRRGGKNLRRRTSYRLGDAIHVDWGPDTYGACLAFGLPMYTVTDLVVTHAHEDHLTPRELWYRRPGFSQIPEDRLLTVHGSEVVGEALRAGLEDPAYFRVAFRPLEAYCEAPVAGGIHVTPIPASHAEGLGGAFNLIFRQGDRRLLVGNDTGWWAEEVWDFLAGLALDAVILDSTYGPRRDRGGHLGVHEVVEAQQRLLSLGGLGGGCLFVANHFSHNGGWLHEELEEFFAPHGIAVGWDGMVVEV